jgi:hypothetical protein
VKRMPWIASLVLLALALAGEQAYAQGKKQAPQTAGEKVRDVLPEAERVFTVQERTVIKDWFANPKNLSGLPPGLAKREKLPPGLERQLKERGKLPPGLQKKIQPLPPELDKQLRSFTHLRYRAQRHSLVFGRGVEVSGSAGAHAREQQRADYEEHEHG